MFSNVLWVCLGLLIAAVLGTVVHFIREPRRRRLILEMLGAHPDGLPSLEIGRRLRSRTHHGTLASLEENRLISRERRLVSPDGEAPFTEYYQYRLTPEGERTLRRQWA